MTIETAVENFNNEATGGGIGGRDRQHGHNGAANCKQPLHGFAHRRRRPDIDLFASVGGDAFDITHTNLAGEKRGFRSNQTLQQARESMPYLIPAGDRRQNNVIVRPRSKTVALIQLDDLSDENRARIAPAAFLILQTSPSGCQAWVAVENAPAGFKSRLKAGLDCDREASGAVRIAGTRSNDVSRSYPLSRNDPAVEAKFSNFIGHEHADRGRSRDALA